MGNCLVSLGWGCGTDAWFVVGMVDGGSPADECELSSTLALSLYFPYPFYPCTVFPVPIGPIVSLPYYLYPFVPLISHNNDTRAPTV